MTDLNTLMHAAVGDVSVDLDRLVAVSVREGTRVRRRRRFGYAGAGLATLALVGVIALALEGHSDTATVVAPASHGATGNAPTTSPPSAGALRAGQTLSLGHGITGTVVACGVGKPGVDGNPACVLPARYREVGSSTLHGSGSGLAVVVTGPSSAVESLWSAGFQSPALDGVKGLTYALAADSPLLQPVHQQQVVTIHLAGWSQVGQVVDDKQMLTGPGGAVADIVWRPASDYADWMRGQGSDPGTWTSPLHGDVFVTIQGGLHTTAADIQALGASLTWD